MKKYLVLCLAIVGLLVTGCPQNQYMVELKPHGKTIERKLSFYRTDGKDTNGVPKYQSFPTNELEAITGVYPTGAVTNDGEGHSAAGEFGTAMPVDVGGAGSYTNLATSLGSAGFYLERFRGNDDLVSMTEERFKAADQLTSLLIGWSKAELGGEAHYPELRQFLDVNFRHDLKNVGSYTSAIWETDATRGQALTPDEVGNANDRSEVETMARCGQYLIERGYLKISEVPKLFELISGHDEKATMQFMQRLVARKMGVGDAEPVPKSLEFLAEPDATEKSFDKYLATTEIYQAKLREWEEKKKSNPQEKQPEPSEVVADLLPRVIGLHLDIGGSDDHVLVKLSLASQPIHSNGRWDETNQLVVWESLLQQKEDATGVPTFCYANWCDPDEKFQKEHFGRVILKGDELIQYCLWRGGLGDKWGAEWDAMVAGLQQGTGWKEKVEGFHFSDEPTLAATGTNAPAQNSSAAYFGQQSIEAGMQKDAGK
jgi:hypothetical protein